MLERVSLPLTDLEVSRLCLGTATFGVKQSEEEVFALLDHFLSLGGNYIDAARIYSDWIPGEVGRCERIIGDWLRARPGIRQQLVLGTKGAHYEWHDKERNRVSQTDVRRDLELSLTALGTDFIDIYYLHRDDPNLGVEEIVDFMQVFIDEGKIRYMAVANWTARRLSQANEYASKKDKLGFVVNQPQYSLGSWNMKPGADPTLVTLDKAAHDYHRETGISIAPYSSQAQGFFTKAIGGMPFDESKFATSRYHNEANQRVAGLIGNLASAKGCNANGIVMAYLIHQPMVVTPIVGCYTKEQLDDSVQASKVVLTRDELQGLEDAAVSGVVH